jgi:hypothetical protein
MICTLSETQVAVNRKFAVDIKIFAAQVARSQIGRAACVDAACNLLGAQLSYENIPLELQELNQWVCWKIVEREGLKPTKLPINPRTGELASVTDPGTWSDFATAVLQSQRWSGIGFVFTEQDEYAGIDLDDTHGDADAYARQIKIYNEFNSYSELSPSGNGLHIIVKAKLPGTGRRRASIELYDKERYFTFTGNIFNQAPIANRQDLACLLYEQMAGPVKNYVIGVDEAQTQTDEKIITIACHAENGEKFNQLFAGHWDTLYPSQSEADFALVDIIAYYTKNKEQIARIFRASSLGKRQKANRDRYIAYMVEKSFDRQLPPVDADGLRIQLQKLHDALQSGAVGKPSGNPTAPASEQEQRSSTVPASASTQGIALPEDRSSFPPGLVGEIAQFIYTSAARPVMEIAVAGAFGLMAGICGRQYNVENTGLNQFILLIADTGRGKEAIANGISKLMRAVSKSVPGALAFEGPTSIASPQALSKYFSVSPCFYSIVGEFGLKLQQMSNPNAPPHLVGLRAALLDLYNKSGAGDVWGAMIYSKKDDNTKAVNSPSFTLIGESTPGTFFENINEAVVRDGMVGRFTIFEYLGDQVPYNKGRKRVEPSFALVQKLSEICAHALSQASLGNVTNVEISPEAQIVLDNFEEFARRIINNCDTKTGIKRTTKPKSVVTEIWNRTHVKALRLASLVAVGINYINPVITADIAQAATDEIYWQTMKLQGRFERGEVGGGAVDSVAAEEKQMEVMCHAIGGMVKKQLKPTKTDNYRVTDQMQKDMVFPFNMLLMRLQVYPTFKNDRRGPSEAIRRTYQQLLDNDDLREIPKQQMLETYGKKCRAFMISNPERFLEEE